MSRGLQNGVSAKYRYYLENLMIKRVCAGAILATVSLMSLAGELPAAIKARGSFQLTINATFPPMEFVDPATNTFRGLDIDLVDTLAARLGLKVERTDGLFKQLIPALTTGRTDFILSGMGDNAERRKSFDYVDYARAGANFFVLHESPIKDSMELCGKKVGTIRSAAYPNLIKSWSDQKCVGTGKPAVEVVGAESSPEVLMQLKQLRFDAGVVGGETIPFVNQQQGGNVFRVVGESIQQPEYGAVYLYYGAAFRKEDSAFRDLVADEFQKMIDDGTYAKIFEKWGLSANMMPAIMINSEPRKK
jgi:polar amino acid transport system substrate-binding protein